MTCAPVNPNITKSNIGQKAKQSKHQIKLNIKPNPCATKQTDQTQEILLTHTKIKHKNSPTTTTTYYLHPAK
jgi:hypothetical protein